MPYAEKNARSMQINDNRASYFFVPVKKDMFAPLEILFHVRSFHVIGLETIKAQLKCRASLPVF